MKMFRFPVKSLVSLNEPNSISNVLFILAGIEGHCQIFTNLAESFAKHNTLFFGLEYTLDVPNTSIKDSARFYLEIIHKKLNELNVKSFSLAGYSYGGIIAIEIVRQLEMSEYLLAPDLQNLVLFESSHTFFRAAVHSNASSMGQRIPNKDIFGRSRIYTAPLSMYLSRIIGYPKLKFEIYNELKESCTHIDDAIQKALSYAAKKDLISFENKKEYEELFQFLKVHLLKSNAAFMYEVCSGYRLKTPLVLMRSEHFIYKRMEDLYVRADYDSEELTKIEFDVNTYELDKICSNLKVEVFKKGNHYSFIHENSDDIVLLLDQLFHKKSKL